MALTKVSGDFIDAGSITQGHLHSSHGITTTHIAEGDKLFFTNARVDSRIGSLSSSDLSEGTNLYYTDARADARIAAADTGDLSEGTNLYYTQARFNSAFTAKSTSDLSEGTNLYYTDARADARITAADTDSLSEGSTNLYYTDARADARVALIVDSSPDALNTLNELAAALNDDADFSTTITTSIGLKAPKASPSFTGNSTFTGSVLINSDAGLTIHTTTNGENAKIDFSSHVPGHTQKGTFAYNHADTLSYGSNESFVISGTESTMTILADGKLMYNEGIYSKPASGTGAGTRKDSNWDTAYGWGNHASAGYLTSLPSHTHDDRYYTESEIQAFFNRGYLSNHSASGLTVGWYTIATNTGDRALGEFQIWDTASGDHQSVLFTASHHFGINTSNDITVLANSRYSGTNFRYIRIKEGGTYDGAALQVYIDGASNTVYAAIVGGNAQESGWVLKDWIADGTDPGDLTSYSSMVERTIVDLDVIINGGIMTTGPIYSGGQTAQYKVLTQADEGSGNGIDADTLDGIQGANYLRSDVEDQGHMLNLGGEISAGSGAKLQVQGFMRTGPIMIASGNTGVTTFNNTNEKWLMNNAGSIYIGDGTNFTDRILTTADEGSYMTLSGNQSITGTKTFSSASLVISGSHGTISFLDNSSSADDFYIHVNSNNFYVLADRQGGNEVDAGYEAPHPLQLEADTNTAYTFGNRILTTADEGSGNGIDADTVDGLQGGSFLRSDSGDTFTGKLSVANTGARRAGMYGIYDSNKTGHIWSMGTAYQIPQDGSDFGNLYGLAYKHTNNSTGGAMASGHQMVWCSNGTPKSAIGTNIWTDGIIDADGATFGGTVSMNGQAISMGNGNITGINHMTMNDPGVNEGLQWTGGNDWYIQECPDAMTNASGNLQFSTGTTRRFTINTSGYVYAERYYDMGSTSYYLDPGGTSVLNAATFAGDITVNGNQIRTLGGNADVKFSVWSGTTYGIGMTSGVTLGNLNDYAMTFCMNNEADRGFWWGYSGQSKGAGAMSLTTGGKLYVSNRVTAPVYYDTNTTYYGDFASTSNFNALNMAGNLRVGSSGTSNIYMGGTSGNYFRFHTNNSHTYFDANVGNVYWRQGSSTRFYFYMSNANMTINGSLTQNSDERVKENIVEIPDAIDKVKAMKGVYYNRTDFNTSVTKVGVLAQDVEAVLPELIVVAPDSGLKSVAYGELTSVLINAIKEQQTIIDDLKSRLETLENQ